MRVRTSIERMRPYFPPMEGRSGLRLDFNENTAGCSPLVMDVLRSVTPDEIARYPEYLDAEADIAASFGHTPATMTLTNGVDDAVQLAVQTTVDPGDEVVVVEPTFSMYRFYAQQAAATVTSVPQLERQVRPGVKRFDFDLDAIRRAVGDRTRLVFIAVPNNPTGAFAEASELLNLADDLARLAPDCTLFLDEAYADFVDDRYRGVLDSVAGRDNLLLARTFSKAYGLAGLRLGALFASPRNMPVLRKAHSPYNVNLLAARCGRAAVRDRKWVQGYRREVIAARAQIESTFERLGIEYWASAANFVLFQAGDNAGRLLARMRASGILLRDRGADVKGAARITCGTSEQTEVALRALAKAWNALAVQGGGQPAPSRLPRTERPRRPWLIFDLDGVLVDVTESYRRAIEATVEELSGIRPSGEEIQELKDLGGFNNDWDLSQELLRRRGSAVPYDRIVTVFNRFYRGAEWDGLIRQERWLLPADRLRALADEYTLAVFTGRPREDAEYVLRRFSALESFAAVVAMEDVTKAKPDPEGLVSLANSCAPALIAAYVGDTVDDARCAAEAGIPYIGVIARSHLSRERLRGLFETIGSIAVVDDVQQAADLLLNRETREVLARSQ
jgi:histidinol-phosphate aminotransferase